MYFLFIISALCGTLNFSDIYELNRILKPFLAENDLIVSVEDELYKFFNNSNVTISLDNDEENYLRIQFNDIKYNVLPKCLGRLINIKTLVLMNNGLSELPDFFEKFTSLFRLDLSSNNFNKLPEVLFLLKNNLTHLYFRYNKFKYLGDGIKNFIQLENLNFNGNDIRIISEEFKSLPKLKILNLNNNGNIIRTSDDDMDYKKDIEFFSKIPKSIEMLYINNTRLRHITCNLKLFPNLLILYASNNLIKNLSCYCDKCISTDPNDLSSIYYFGKLKELSLSENQIHGTFFIARNMFLVLEKLDLTLCNIKEFEVEGYNIMNSINGEYIEYENPSTKNRSNSSNNTSNIHNAESSIIYSLQHLSITIKKTYVVPNLLIFPNLRYLKIINKERNNFRTISDIVRSLFDGLSEMKFLKYLELYKFNLVTIPKPIYNLKNLESILLSYCKIEEIQDGIENLSNLTRVDLNHNNIGNINPKIFTLTRPIKIVLTKNPLKYLPSSINNDNSNFTLKIWGTPMTLFKTDDDNLGIMDISYKKIHQIKGYKFRDMSSMTIKYLYEKAHKGEYKWELDQMLTIKNKEVEGSQDNYDIIITYWNILEKYITDDGIKEKFPNYLQLLYGIKKRRGEEVNSDFIETTKKYIEAIFKILTNLVEVKNTENIEKIIREMKPGLYGCVIYQAHHFSYAYHLLLFDENESKSIESFICNKLALLKYNTLREIITNNNEEQKITRFSNWQNKLSGILGLPSIPQKYGINTNNIFLKCREYIIYQFFKLISVENVVKDLYKYINNKPENVKMASTYISARQQYDMNSQEHVKNEERTSITEQEIYFILEEMGLIKRVVNKRTNKTI